MDFISIKTLSGQVEKEKKKISDLFLPDPGKSICKKNQKKKKRSFSLYFYANYAETDRERDKKNFVPSQPGLEHSQINSKKIQKRHSNLISKQIGLRQAEKETKKISFRVSFQNISS